MPSGLLQLTELAIALRKRLAVKPKPAAASVGLHEAGGFVQRLQAPPALQAHRPNANFRQYETDLR